MFSLSPNIISKFTLFLIIGGFLSFGSLANEKNIVTNEDKIVARSMLEISKKQKWIEYKKLLNRIQSPILKKVLYI